ncbi:MULTISPECIES: hypothetical protein [Streptomyces]|uniref:Uncharacterized protein n=1 Tax=Streptomyces lonegramiae TaxID=3075524 RepID=A0ABU2XG49_9ACTN|nr:hypothetical protein [Streptomyces sp. DSM 41529]MDT0544911.1 hypothetical protein [Streptomyces sp. DSM 41529]
MLTPAYETTLVVGGAQRESADLLSFPRYRWSAGSLYSGRPDVLEGR